MNFMQKSILISALFILFLSISAISGVSASTYYVNTTGDDSSLNPTDPTTPFESVGKAVNTTNAGSGNDEIVIANGTYSGGNNRIINISQNVNIYSAKYRGYTTQDTIIDAQQQGTIFMIEQGVTVNFYGIVFVNGNSTVDVTGGLGGGAIYNNGSIIVNYLSLSTNYFVV